jgi:ABC-type dipeptide/oligopeptide/nickel transport system ATPase component
VITRFYDSLLEKVTAWAPTPEEAALRMDRALREFRIRGVATNLVFLENLLKHPAFRDGSYTTRFIDTTPALFEFRPRRDRATKLLRFIGDVTVNGFDAGETEMRRSLGFLPGESPLYDEMSPRGYLRFFADLYDVDRETADERIAATLDRLEMTQRDRKLGDCSKGMRRKVAIARSLVNDPETLIYDEPASGLDPLTTHEVTAFTRELAAEGKTVLFSAHDLCHVEGV